MKVINPMPLSNVPPSSSVHEKTSSSIKGLPLVVIKAPHKENNPHSSSSKSLIITRTMKIEQDGDQLQPPDQSTGATDVITDAQKNFESAFVHDAADLPSTTENPDESGIHMMVHLPSAFLNKKLILFIRSLLMILLSKEIKLMKKQQQHSMTLNSQQRKVLMISKIQDDAHTVANKDDKEEDNIPLKSFKRKT
ncbi:hypothetical protein Sjap_002541 [Stephania japonica]|uniref:Uncharacterized protein n=1 Tax=Stephania japonica TaxID=461633 RepID=A0AAP0KM23_9MAGN